MTTYNVGLLADFPVGSRRILDVGGRSIGVFNVDGKIYALRNRCPHQGGPLCAGRLFPWLESAGPGDYRYDDGRHLIECPWHGWEFDLATGRSRFDPARTRVRSYPVRVGRLAKGASQPRQFVRGPYTAETFPITVEDEHVVIEIGG